MTLFKKIIDENDGDSEVILVIGVDDKRQVIKLPNHVNIVDELVSHLEDIVGEGRVVIK